MDKIVRHVFKTIERIQIILNSLRRGPEPLYALSDFQTKTNSLEPKFSIKDLIGNGFLWAVPRSRRTIERRWQRKFGSPEYVWKMIKPKSHIRTCNQCGHDHEAGVLCPHCYEKVKKETELMQEKIQSALGNEKDDREVIVLYEGEKNDQCSDFFNGKRIVEMAKPRPMWFSKNLMQKSTQKPAITKEVKPSDLG